MNVEGLGSRLHVASETLGRGVFKSVLREGLYSSVGLGLSLVVLGLVLLGGLQSLIESLLKLEPELVSESSLIKLVLIKGELHSALLSKVPSLEFAFVYLLLLMLSRQCFAAWLSLPLTLILAIFSLMNVWHCLALSAAYERG